MPSRRGATQQHDLDTARRPLQIAAGIEAGDIAGLFFSFMDSENSQWFKASPAERRGGFGNGWYSNNVTHPSNRSHTAFERGIADARQDAADRRAPRLLAPMVR
ncbi:hypothetical protein UB46_29430 [Burkholderiaceae bacterium 16]|nr:hypothetical protein UB46_29430 [Burkholderiaceae bacterium 16]